MTRVMLTDDHDILREGLKKIIEAQGSLRVTAEASGGKEALQLLRGGGQADVLVLDIAMPDMDGLELLLQLQNFPDAPAVLVLSMYPEKEYAAQAFRLGARGYIRKDSPPAELISAIRRVASGRRYISPALADMMAASWESTGKDGENPAEKPRHETLSLREKQVFLALAQGRTTGEIAQSLSLSENTVRTYRSRILKKLACRSTVELSRYAAKHGLLL